MRFPHSGQAESGKLEDGNRPARQRGPGAAAAPGLGLGGGSPPAVRHRLDFAAFGVTSREPLQSLPTLTLLDADRPAVVEASEISLGST